MACLARLQPTIGYHNGAKGTAGNGSRLAIWAIAGAVVLLIAVVAATFVRITPASKTLLQIPTSHTFQSLAEQEAIFAPIDYAPDRLRTATSASTEVQTLQKPAGSSLDNLVFDHRSEIAAMLDSLHGIGVGTEGLLANNKLGVEFASNNGNTVLVLRTVCLSTASRLRGSTGRERAAVAIGQSAIPILLQMSRNTSAPTCDQVGVIMAYGTGETQRVDEVVSICSPRQLCEELDKGQITDQQLIDGSTIFFSGDETSRIARRITITQK